MTDEQGGLARGFMARAEEELLAVENDLAGGFVARAVGGSYYAVLYAVRALLATRGLETNRHSAVMRLFGREFVEPGLMSKEHSKTLGLLLERRLSAHYRRSGIHRGEGTRASRAGSRVRRRSFRPALAVAG